MALGPNLTTVTITGSYVDFEGNPIEGQIRFSISEVLRNGTDDQMVAPSSVVVPLSSGSFSVAIPATNDPDVVPNPFEYTVEESFPNGRTYAISIPYTTSGSLDLADISPDPALSESYVAAVDLTSWNTLESNITALDALIDQSVDKFPASGQYWYIDSAYSTYTALDYASSASSSATTAQNNSAGTISPLLLIGG